MNLTFGKYGLKYEAATKHFAFIGSTGAGKTVLIRLLMQSILQLATQSRIPTRLIVYDSKREMLPVLYGMFERLGRKDAKNVIDLINPFDKRSVAWDLAEDIKSPAHAQELASILIPDNPNAREPFFPNAARLILENVVLSFIEGSKKNDARHWTLRDLCNAVETRENIELVLGRSTRTNWVPDALFADIRTAGNILATIAAAMRPYRIIAALWEKAEGKMSLHKWLEKEMGILVLGNTPTSRTTIDAINQVLFKRLSQIILEKQRDIKLNEDLSRIWVFLDEFVRAGRLSGAAELATEGRSKGVAFVVGFQDVNGLYAVYGREEAEEIIGQCSSVALLRTQSPDTAEWQSRFIGDYQLSRGTLSSTTHSKGESSRSIGDEVRDRRPFLPSHFREMPPVSKDRKQGISGVFCSPYFLAPDVTLYDASIGYSRLFEKEKQTLNEGHVDVEMWRESEIEVGFAPHDDEHQYLDAWRPEDKKELKLDKPVKPKKDADPLANTGKPASSEKGGAREN